MASQRTSVWLKMRETRVQIAAVLLILAVSEVADRSGLSAVKGGLSSPRLAIHTDHWNSLES